MLEVLGDDWIAQHIYNELQKEYEEKQYKAYITDCLMCIAGVEERWVDMTSKPKEPTEPEKTEEELIALMEELMG